MRLPSQVERDRDEVRRGGLYAFLRLCWPIIEQGKQFVGGRHLQLICRHLEAASRGELRGRTLVINVPPGTGKSSLICRAWTAWHWAEIDPSSKWFFGSFSDRLSRRDSKRTHKLVSSEWYRARWSVRLDHDATESGEEYSTTAGGMRYSTTILGQVTGWHPDFKIADDPNPPKEADASKGVTKKALEATADAWSGTWGTRGEPSHVTSVIVQQRVHEGDLTGVVTEDIDTVRLVLPMEYDPEEHSSTPWGEDWRRDPYELLCPERLDREAVERLKRKLRTPANVAAQLQQRPQAKSGGVFQRAWFKIVDELPKKPGVWLQAWDCNFGDKDEADKRDPVVGTTLVLIESDIYVVDVDWARSTFDETLVRMARARKKWPQVLKSAVERQANGSACVQTMRRKIPGFVAVENGNKATRAHSASAIWQAGNGYVLRAHWNQPFIEEHVGWPRLKLDDRVDSCCHGIVELAPADISRYLEFVAALTGKKKAG